MVHHCFLFHRKVYVENTKERQLRKEQNLREDAEILAGPQQSGEDLLQKGVQGD